MSLVAALGFREDAQPIFLLSSTFSLFRKAKTHVKRWRGLLIKIKQEPKQLFAWNTFSGTEKKKNWH